MINFSGKRRDRAIRARRAWGRSRLGLESLEGRELMAASPLATTPDRSGNPVDFLIRPDASVVVNQERPTNDVTAPFQYSGYQALSGLGASSITAFTLPNGDPAVVAMTGPQSYLYLNRYTATGNPAIPYAWTGWQQFGSFVATSVTSASNGASGAAVFAVGVDAKVYAAPYDPSTTATSASTAFSGFGQLPGFSASSISVLADGASSYEVTALGGPQSYVEDDKVVVSAGTVQPTGWQQVGNFVATSISLTLGLNTTAIGTSLGDRLFLFAVGTDGALYYDFLTLDPITGGRDSTAYVMDTPGRDVASSTALVADGYITVYALSTSGEISYDQITATGLSADPLYDSGWIALNAPNPFTMTRDFLATVITTIPTADGGSDLFELDTTGVDNVVHLLPHPAVGINGIYFSNPGYTIDSNDYTGFSDLANRSYHPIASASGPTGLPIVVSLGSDGSVSANRDLAAGAAGAADTYSGFSKLDGLSATSIAATTEPNGFAVFALMGQQSNIFEDQYLATGNSATPYAWTGWQQLGSFVATSIAAATSAPGGAAATAGPTVFGLGVNGVISATSPTPSGADPTQATFTPLNGLAATSFSVKSLPSQILVAALTNTQSDAYADLYTPLSSGSAGWTLTGNYVMTKVIASTTPSGAPVVAGISPLGYQAVSLSLDGTSPPPSSPGNYQPLNFPTSIPFEPAPVPQRSEYIGIGFAPLAIPDGSSVAYLELAITPGGIFLATSIPDGSSGTYSSPIQGSGVGQSLATSSDATSSNVYLGDNLGQIYVSQAAATGDSQAPLSFSGFVSLGTV